MLLPCRFYPNIKLDRVIVSIEIKLVLFNRKVVIVNVGEGKHGRIVGEGLIKR